MAKIVEEILTVKVSHIVKDTTKDDDNATVLTDKHVATVEATLHEVLDLPGVVVEVIG